MRILRVAQKVYPETKGGGAYHVHAMSRDQAAMGHDVTVLTVEVDGDSPRIEERDGYTVIRNPVTINALRNDISAGVASYLRDADDFDVIHAHSHLYFSTNLAALKRAFGGPPLAITNHGLYSQNAPEWLFDLYLWSVGKWTFNRADIVFCYTEEDKERVSKFGVNTDIAVVPNGVDTARFSLEGPTSDLIEHEGPVVLFIGRLVDGKRPQDAIEAVAKLPEELNAKLYVVGDGPMYDDLAARGGDDVEFLGHVPYNEMSLVYRAGDVLLLSSRAEGLPRTVLEAFASGLPVVSSHLEHTAPIVERGGETVSVGDVDGYSETLNRVLNKRDRLGEQGREAVAEEFRWEKTVKLTTEKLNQISSL